MSMGVLQGLTSLTIVSLLTGCFGQKKDERTEFSGSTTTSDPTSQTVVSSGQKSYTGTKPAAGTTGTIVVAPGEPVATEVNSQTLGIPSGVKPAGAPVNTSTQTATAGQIVLSIPYDPNYQQTSLLGLTADPENVVVYYHVEDASGANVVGVIPNDQLTINDDKISFVSRGEGNYQAAVVPEPIEEEVTEPVKAPAYDPSIAKVASTTVEFTSISLVATGGRGVRLTAQYSAPGGVTLDRCVAVLDENKVVPFDQSVSVSTFDVQLTVAKLEAHTTHGQYQCQDSLGRSVSSPWSNGVAIAASTLPNVSMSLIGVASDGWVNEAERSNALPWFSYTTTNTQSIAFTSFVTTPGTCSPGQSFILSEPPSVNALAADGTYWVCVKATSPDSRVQFFTSPSFVRDTQAPAVSFPVLPDSNGVINLSATVSGHDSMLWSSVPAGTFSDASSPVSEFTAPASGTYAITLTATDAAGNSAELSRNAVVDKDVPVIASFTPISALFNIASHAAQAASALFTVSASDASALTYAYSGFLSSGTCDGSQNYSSSTIPQVSDLSSASPVYICVRVTDAVGNVAYAQSGLTQADLSAPTITFNSIPLITSANHTAVVLAGTCSETGRNVALSGDHTASVTCTAGSWSVTANLSAKSDGTLNFTAATTDAAGNPASVNQSANKDANPSNATISGQPTGTSKVTSGTITFGGIGVVAVKYKIVSGTTCSGASFTGGEVAAGPQNLDWSSQPEGPVSICAIGKDAAGNWQAEGGATNVNWVKDTTAPTFTSLLGANGASDGYVNASESGSSAALFVLVATGQSLAEYTTILDDTPAQNCNASQSYAQASIPLINAIPGVDDSYAVCVRLTDAAGNVSYGKSQTIIRDTVAPVVNAGPDVAANALVAIDATVTGGASFQWVKHLGTGTVTFGSANAEDTTASASAEGAFTLRLTASDAAGNSAYDDMVLTWDVTAPTFTSLAKAGAAIDGYVNDGEKSGTTALWTLNASDYANVVYTAPLDNASNPVCNAQTYGPASIARAVDLPASDKDYVICVRLMDAAGNTTYGKSQPVTRDTTYPVFTSLDAVNQASDGYVNSSESSSNLALLSLSASGHTSANYTVVLVDSPITCDGSKSYGSSSIPLINAIPASDGAYAVCVRLADAAGNVTYGKSAQVIRDTNAPTVNVGADVTTNAMYTTSVTTSGDAGATYAWTKESGPGTLSFGSPAAKNTTISSSAEGAHTLRLTVTDAAGNGAYDEMLFTWDVSVPVFTSLNRTGDASDGYVNGAEKNNTTALWSLSASGQSTTMYTAALDDTVSVVCDAGKTYGQPSIARAADLPASDKPYVICVKLADAAGNITYGKSQVVTLDTQAPTATLSGQPSGTVYNLPSLDVTVAGATATHYKYALVASAGADCSAASYSADTAVATHITSSLSATPGATNYTLCVVARDVAGNYQAANAATSAGWTLNNTSVTISSAPSHAHGGNYTAFPINGTCEYGSGNVTVKFNATTVSSSITCSTGTWSANLNLTSIADSATAYSVTAIYSGKTSSAVLVYKDITAPTPGTLGVGTVTANSVQLSWSEATDAVTSAGAFRYRVYRSTSASFDSIAQVEGGTQVGAETSTLSMTASGLSATTTYYFNVIIVDEAGNKAVMNKQSATTPSGSPHFTQMAGGNASFCALSGGGKVFCWGDNANGQLGDNTTTQRSLPTAINSAATFNSVAVGQAHACAVQTDGTVNCWGKNLLGQVGDGTSGSNKTSPVAVNTVVKFSKVAAGSDSTCAIALAPNNYIYCWGSNAYGELANGVDGGTSTSPTQITGTRKWVDIAAGQRFFCAIEETSNDAYCWGLMDKGRTGTGSYTGELYAPTAVIGGQKYSKLALGMEHGCGVTIGGKIYCWGANTYGQLGVDVALATNNVDPTEIKASGGSTLADTFTDVSSYSIHTCARTTTNATYCWGDNQNYQLGLTSPTYYAYAALRSFADTFPKITAGAIATCGISAANVAKCWGNGAGYSYGILGNNVSNTVSADPVTVNMSNVP